MYEENDVLFVRRNSKAMDNTNHDDVWDDSVLIKAYDKAINLAKEEVTKRMEIQECSQEKHNKSKAQKEHRHSQKTQRKWCVGSPCRAVYSEDGELYEAVITKIQENTGTCIVKFIGYENTEKVELSSLLESEGLQSQIAQHKASLQDKVDSSLPEASELSSEHRKMNGNSGENMECDFGESKPSKNTFTSLPTTSSTFTSLPTTSTFNPTMGMMPPAPPLPPHLMSKLPENDADALSSMLMSWYISGFHTGYYHGLKQAKSTQEKRKK